MANSIISLARLSPSSRRAWIEIAQVKKDIDAKAVALLAEGVDRNSFAWLLPLLARRRPPRGGRG